VIKAWGMGKTAIRTSQRAGSVDWFYFRTEKHIVQVYFLPLSLWQRAWRADLLLQYGWLQTPWIKVAWRAFP